MRLDVDVVFNRAENDSDGNVSAPFSGAVQASGRHITVKLTSEQVSLTPSKALKDLITNLADGLATRGLTLTLVGPQGTIASIGDVSVPAIQRLFTRSQHIRVESVRALSRFVATRSQENDSSGQVLPPPTLWPLVPTVNRRIRRNITTTHHTRGSGRPRLLLVKEHPELGPGPLLEFNLEKDSIVIGSSDSCDLQLSGIDPEHAEITHTEKDEYILSARGVTSGSINRESRGRVVLRTGSRVHIGPWRLVFHREEYADHGRPYGGRQGGEFSIQRPQYNPYRRNAT